MIGAIENAIIDQLRARSDDGTFGYLYRTLESYPDDFDAYFAAKKGLMRAPAAWCVFLALDDCFDPGDGTGAQGTGRFALIVAAQNLRNETATRQGGPDGQAEPGSYQLAVDAARVLTGNSLYDAEGISPLTRSISISGLRLVQRTKMMAENNLSLMAIELRCSFSLGKFQAGAEGQFEQLHVDWDVPPIGNVEAPLPAAEADASDDVQVPQ